MATQDGNDDGLLHDVTDDRTGHRGADDVLRGGDNDDRLSGRPGEDHLDGGNGVDTAIYPGFRASYIVEHANDGTSRITVTAAAGHHVLENIERLQFDDKKVAFDLGPGQAAGDTVRIVAAAFWPGAVIGHPDYVGIGLQLFEAGHNMQQVAQLAATVLGLDDDAFIDRVYQNVVGVLPTPETHDFFQHLLQGHGGTMSQADLLVLAANNDATAQRIDLVGMMQSGVEYV